MDGMDHGHNHGGGGMAAPPPMDMHPHHRMMMMMHMTFFWGKNTEVLFDGWPGTSVPMYALSLIVVFLLAAIVECLSHSRLIRPGTTNAAAVALLRTLLHAVRMGLAYLVMLAVMSFNGGIFLAAVAGHALGFLFSGAGLWRKPDQGRLGNSDLPPMSC